MPASVSVGPARGRHLLSGSALRENRSQVLVSERASQGSVSRRIGPPVRDQQPRVTPVHHLDHLAFSDERWTPRPLAERVREVERIVAQPAWVAEGGHLGWTEPPLRSAAKIAS